MPELDEFYRKQGNRQIRRMSILRSHCCLVTFEGVLAITQKIMNYIELPSDSTGQDVCMGPRRWSEMSLKEGHNLTINFDCKCYLPTVWVENTPKADLLSRNESPTHFLSNSIVT